jgi:hypothetical protein
VGGPTACRQAPSPGYGVHFLFLGPGVTPSSSPLAPTLGCAFPHCSTPAAESRCCRLLESSWFIGRPSCTHAAGQWPMQNYFVPAFRRSRPSAFAVAGVARPQSCIGQGHARQDTVAASTCLVLEASQLPSVRSRPAWRLAGNSAALRRLRPVRVVKAARQVGVVLPVRRPWRSRAAG